MKQILIKAKLFFPLGSGETDVQKKDKAGVHQRYKTLFLMRVIKYVLLSFHDVCVSTLEELKPKYFLLGMFLFKKSMHAPQDPFIPVLYSRNKIMP